MVSIAEACYIVYVRALKEFIIDHFLWCLFLNTVHVYNPYIYEYVSTFFFNAKIALHCGELYPSDPPETVLEKKVTKK